MTRSKFVYCASGLLAIGTGTSVAQNAEQSTGGATLEEVIVTAERREADLQKTAIAITALGADALANAGVSRPEDLNKLMPGLGIAQGGSSTQVYVRGVGNYGTNALADPAVAFNIDGIYIGRFSGISGTFFDVARVEVLKGPQGTLYGRNATGGAINIVTNKPVDDFAAGVDLQAGNYSLRHGSAFVNVPLSERFAMRVAGQWTDRDGYQSDGNDDDESRAGRVHLLFDPGENLQLLVTGGFTKIGGQGPAQIPVTANGYVNNSDPWEGLSVTAPVALLNAVTPAIPDMVINGLNRDDGRLDVEVAFGTVQLDTQVAIGTLTLIGNYMDTANESRSYGPGFLFQQDDDAEQTSLEARLAGETGTFDWVGGLYYYREDQSTKFWVDQGFLFNQTGLNLDRLDDETRAVFGQVTYRMNERLRLTGGLRYTDETKEQNGNAYTRLGMGLTCAALGGTPVSIANIASVIPFAATNGNGVSYPFPYCSDTMTGERTWDDVSWKAGVDFDVRDDSMLYASVSRGFKAGGFFSSGDNTDVGNTYEPETLVAYAVGAKNRFFSRRLQLNAEAFFWDYKDHQENYLAPAYFTINSFNFITQSADGEIYGLDIELDALLTDVDTLGIKAQYLHAEYTDAVFQLARPNTQPPSTACSATQSPSNPTLYSVDCTGQQMPRSPEFSFTVAYQHTFALPGGSRLIPGVNVQYSSSYWSAVDYNPLQKQDSYAMYGAELTFDSGKNWTFTAFGANLSDEDVYTNSFMYPGTNVAMNSLRAPRTYGARVNVKF